MICLDDTDVLEAWSDTDAVIDCSIHGLVGTTFTNLYTGTLGNAANVVIYTAGAAISVVSITFVNTGGAAATVNLKLDPANGGNDKFLLPVAVSLGAGYGLVFDGQRFTVMNPSGQVVSVLVGLQNVVEDLTPQLGAELDAGAHTIGFTAQTATGDGTTTIDWRLGNKFHFTHGAMAETFTFTAPTKPCNLVLKIKQDGVGSRDSTFPVTVKWLGSEPTWTDGGAAKTIIMSMYYDGTNYWSVGTEWEA